MIPGKNGIQAAEKGGSVTLSNQKSKTSQSNYILKNISAQNFTQRIGLLSYYTNNLCLTQGRVAIQSVHQPAFPESNNVL